jgi:hypothetical protein
MENKAHPTLETADLVVIMLAILPKVRGLKPGRGRRIFKDDRIRNRTSLRGEVDLSDDFTACLRTLRNIK